MDNDKIRVIAAEGARVPHRDELGRPEPGRYIGRNAQGDPEAEEVPRSANVLRALRRGDLVEAPSTPNASPSQEP